MHAALQKHFKALISAVILLLGIILPNTNFDVPLTKDAFGQNLEKLSTNEFKHPKIDSKTLQIKNQKEIKKQLSGLSSDEDKVRVVIEVSTMSSENVDKLKKYGAVIESTYGVLVQALVPFYELENVPNLEFVKYISQPIELEPAVISEGTSIIGADLVDNSGNTGQGTKVAIIDIGFDLTNPEIAGNILEAISFRADGDITAGGDDAHGTAVAEIIVDVAPGVQLFLYNIQTTIELLNAINFIINNRNIDIISMSLGTTVGPQDGTSDSAQALNNARNNGILFVVSAGNEAQEHWEGQFSDPDVDSFHNFSGSDETININAIAGEMVQVILNWSDWPISTQDYDLFILDNFFNVLASSVNPQCTQPAICPGFPPYEVASFQAPYTGTYHVVITRFSATSTPTFDLYSSHDLSEYNVPSSSLSIPGDASGAFTVGATFWQNDQLEDFSSRGPTNDGRIKPDISGPDGVTTSALNPFYGTSAAAPHVAGAAALVKAANPGASANTIQSLLEQNTASNHPKNNNDGTGRVDLDFLVPATIIINSVSDTTPRWDVDMVSISGATTNAQSTDTVTVDWGDGSSTAGLSLSGSLWGPMSHTYDSAHVGTNQIVARLVDNGNNVKATSAASAVNVVKHKTALSMNAIANVKWGKTYTITGSLTDTDVGAAIGSKPLTFDGTAEANGGSITDTATAGDGTFSTTGTSPGVPSNGRTVQAHFAGDSAYEPSNSNIVKFSVLKRSATLVLRDPDVKNVPWGRPTSFPVTLNDKDNSLVGIPGATVSFTGTGVIGVSDQVTNVSGKAIGAGTSPDMVVACGFTVQAHFAGNSLYRAANSPIRDYCTLKHGTTLSLSVSPGTLGPSGKYAVSGTLKDRLTGIPLISKTISFTADTPIVIANTMTDALGKFRVTGLIAPTIAGVFHIQAHFAGDSLYSARDSVIKTLTVV